MESSRVIKEVWVSAALVRYERPLLHYALRITRNAESARDAVQETFLKLCQADQEKIQPYLAPWLYTVCRNHALQINQKEGRMNRLHENDAQDRALNAAAPAGLDPGACAERREFHQRVKGIVEGLPSTQQEVFWLKFRDGLTYREISDVTGVSLGSVSQTITAALNALRNELRSEMDLAQEV